MSQNQRDLHVIKESKDDKIKKIQEERSRHEQIKNRRFNHRKNWIALFINLSLLVLAVLIEVLILSKIIPMLIGTIVIAALVIGSFFVSSILNKELFSKKK